MREPSGGAWSLFVGDVGWSARTCLRAPLVPALWVLTVLVLSIDIGPFAIFLLPLMLFDAGLTGAVRVSFAKLLEEQEAMPFASVWSAAGVCLNRFVCLGLAITVILTPIGAASYLIGGGGTSFVVTTTLAIAVFDVVATLSPQRWHCRPGGSPRRRASAGASCAAGGRSTGGTPWCRHWPCRRWRSVACALSPSSSRSR